MFVRLKTFLLDLLFPRVCIRCGREGTWLCEYCAARIPAHLHHGTTWSLFSFETPWVAQAIHSLKYAGTTELAALFGTLLADRWPQDKAGPDLHAVVTAVPLHARRERERGFNQSEEVARAFAGALHLPYAQLLERYKRTQTQTKLDLEERQRNVLGAFRVRKRIRSLDTKHKLVFPLKTVILIDDVVTTGATLREASSVLRNAGTTTVIPMTVAFAPRLHPTSRSM